MFSKKGVSEVVANVLIVLLVIVGVAVIWSVVKPTIDSSAEQIQADCFTMSVEATSCVLDPDSGGSLWDIIVIRNSGAGAFSEIDLLFEDSLGETQLVPSGITTLTELSTQTADDIDPDLNGNGFTPVKVSAILKVNDNICPVSAQPVTCTTS